MDCGSCAMTIENSLRALPGVETVSVSFATESMELAGEVSREAVEQRLRELGYRLATDEPGRRPAALPEGRGLGGFLHFLWSQPRLRVASAVGIAVAIATAVLAGRPAEGLLTLDLVYALAVLIVGLPIMVKGLRALLFARRVTIDLLMAIAATGALLIGEGGEACTVILLFALGEALEAYSAERARDSLRSLMALQPQEATVLREHDGAHHEAAAPACTGHAADGHAHAHEHGHDGHDHDAREHACSGHGSHEHESHGGTCSGDAPEEHGGAAHLHQVVVPVEQVVPGDRVLVRPGQRIPVDGEVLEGVSAVNQAAVTGESIPVSRQAGDAVLAGTVNGEGALTIRVTAPARDSTIARIAQLVEQAQAQRSPAERFIDRFARWYTPAVVLLALLVVAVPVLALGQPLLDGADGAHGWLYRGLALLIIACPCALVISIPVTVVSALTRLANLGVLVKGGAQLDELAGIQAVAFDKTGTLTHGRPQVTAVRGLGCDHEPDVPECATCDDVVALAATVEAASEHPVAHAIVSAANHRRLGQRYAAAGEVTAHAGRGVSGRLSNGVKIAVGSDALFAETPNRTNGLETHADRVRTDGNTVMFVARDDQVIGYIGVQDAVRDISRRALAELHAGSKPVRTVMLTGDNPQVAARVAEQVGYIDDVRAGLMPADKLSAIERLRSEYGSVAMVGDGINDAPALARADIGIAMGGSGTAQAMETADVVLMQDDLSHVPLALRLARKSRTLVKQNIVLSLALKLAFLALAIPGLATLWMAVLADVGATLLVTLNGMRMLRQS